MELDILMNGQNVGINLFPASVVEEIIQNIRILCSTVVGTVPLNRKLGVNANFIDLPMLKAQMKARIYIIETIQDYEPRAEVVSIKFEAPMDNAHQGVDVKVKVRLLDEYIT